MAQHAILRFEKHKGNPASPLEAHHERQKEQYASNPDIDTSRSKYNFHIVKPEGRYYHFIQSRIEQAGCRTKHRIILDFNTWRKRFLLTMGYDPLQCPNCKKEMLFLELYHKHERVSLAELYERTMRKHGMRPRSRSA